MECTPACRGLDAGSGCGCTCGRNLQLNRPSPLEKYIGIVLLGFFLFIIVAGLILNAVD